MGGGLSVSGSGLSLSNLKCIGSSQIKLCQSNSNCWYKSGPQKKELGLNL